MSEKCVHHGDKPDRHCALCELIQASEEKAQLEQKVERFYRWFSKSMSRDQVDAMLERMPPAT